MSDVIGSAAGLIWNFLNENGPSSVAKLTKETGLDSKTTQRAIGWLAKEDKLVFEEKGRTEMLCLK